MSVYCQSSPFKAQYCAAHSLCNSLISVPCESVGEAMFSYVLCSSLVQLFWWCSEFLCLNYNHYKKVALQKTITWWFSFVFFLIINSQEWVILCVNLIQIAGKLGARLQSQGLGPKSWDFTVLYLTKCSPLFLVVLTICNPGFQLRATSLSSF